MDAQHTMLRWLRGKRRRTRREARCEAGAFPRAGEEWVGEAQRPHPDEPAISVDAQLITVYWLPSLWRKRTNYSGGNDGEQDDLLAKRFQRFPRRG
ncbi:MAG: hypothetical protein AAGG00_17790 [Cyanobacteria bacterium P01_H01_bin.150]